MRPWVKKGLYVIVLLLIVAQLFPPARTNPPVDPSRTIHAALTIEPTVASALARACNDCHSNLTVWPWYSQVAPASWLVVSDVRRGRGALNFSDWKSLAPEKQQKLPPEICKEVTDRDMPTEEYVLMHPRARLTTAEVASICRWVHFIQPGTQEAEREGGLMP
jgi:heme-binding protein